MRKLLLLAFVLISFTAFSQLIGNPGLDQSPNAFEAGLSPAKASWNLQFQHSLNRVSTAGIAADTAHFWITVWNANKVYKVSHAGVLLDSVVGISGNGFPTAGGLRDITWDGTYFYGGTTTATIYKMDFSSGSCVGTIVCPTGTQVRWITYDPLADGGQGGFWVGNWSDGAKLISRTGTLLNSISSTNLPGLSCYGAAYDTTTANGGPYLWLFSQTNNGNDLVQVNVNSKLPTGLVYDITQDVTVASGSIAGGAFIQKNIVTNTTTIGGMVQGQKIFGYDLSSTIPPPNDIALTVLDVPQYQMANQAMQIKGTIQNQGTDTIHSYNLNWQIDGGTINTQNITGQNLLSYATANFTHTDTWTPTTTGIYNLKCWTDSPNGLTDDDTANDTLTAVITVVSQIVQRLPMHEAFTSSTCGPCVAGNNNLKSVFNANPNKWVCLKYQMSWPGNGDPYYTAEGGTRRTFYGINSVPALVVDGAPSMNSSSYTSTMLNTAYNKAAFVNLTAEFEQPGDGKTVNISVNIDPAADIAGAGLKLFAGIFEYNTTQNVGSNGESSFDFVMKKMVPNASGTTISALTSGTPVSQTLSYTFNGNYRLPANALSPINHATEHSVEEFNDLGVVVWLQNINTKEMYQAAYATKIAGISKTNDGSGIIALFPNPTSDNAFLKYQIKQASYVKIEVYDVTGRLVLSHNDGVQAPGVWDMSIPSSALGSGLYLVKLHIGDNVFTDKLNIRK